MRRDPMRYALQLEMLEQDGVDDGHAIALLRSEFALAHNAARFAAVTGEDIELGTVTRSSPQEGVARYLVELLVHEREHGIDDHRALARLRRAFTDALNASYFTRVFADAVTMRLVSRTPVGTPLPFAA